MKNLKRLIILILVCFSFIRNVNATTNIYVRTRDNLRVPKDVEVTSDNINDVLNTPSVSAKDKIYDLADVLTDSEENEIYNSLKKYKSSSKIDSVIVTTRDLGNVSISDYTYNFYDFNDFENNGLIFVIYINDNNIPEIYMGTSGEDETVLSIYTNNVIKQTLAYVYEKNLRSSDYYSACINYVKIIQGFYDVNRVGDYRVSEDGNIVKVIPWLELVVLSLTVTFIIVMLLLYSLGMFKNKVSTDKMDLLVDKNNMIVKLNEEVFIDSVVGGKKNKKK